MTAKTLRAVVCLAFILGGCTVNIDPTDLSSIRVGASQATVENVLGKPTDTQQSETLKLAKYGYDKGGSREVTCWSSGKICFILAPIIIPINAGIDRDELKEDQRGTLVVIYDETFSVVWYGVEKKYASAWLRVRQEKEFSDLLYVYKQALAGNQKALLLLGAFGLDETQNWRWICEAANQGNGWAQQRIGDYFARGPSKNYEYGYIWYSLSNLNAEFSYDRLLVIPHAGKLTREQRERADQIIDKVKPNGNCDPDRMGQMKLTE